MIRNLIKIVRCKIIKIIFIFLTLNYSPWFAKENLSLNHDNLIINLEGDFIQGGLVKGQTNKNITIKFKDKILRKTSNGEFVMNQKATAANRQTLEAMNSGQSVQQGGGYIANQTVQVEVGLGRNSQATADAASASVINAINQGNADGRRSRRRAR